MARMTNTSFMTGIKNWVLGKIANIMALIPNQASSSNQLADKNFVNSSIATATATFRGTYNVVSDLSLSYNATHAQIEAALVMKMAALSIVVDNNDYAFVQIPTSDATPTEIAMIEKYKYDGTAWAFEYELNNSGFTAAQWAAINSGATLELIGKLSALPTNAELITILNSKASKAANPTAGHLASLDGSGNPTDSGVGIEDNGAYDVTLHNNNAKFASLSELLNSANLNTLIPVDKRYGGMSIKFVQSSDNKYVQFRYMGTSTANTDFTNVYNWQGVNDTPTIGSDNLTNSNGIAKALSELNFLHTKELSKGTSSSNVKLVGDKGLRTADANYEINRYSVTAGNVLKLNLAKDGEVVFQFQDDIEVPNTGTNTHLIGHSYKEGIGVIKVPTGATYLIVSKLKTTETNYVGKVLLNVDDAAILGSGNLINSEALVSTIGSKDIFTIHNAFIDVRGNQEPSSSYSAVTTGFLPVKKISYKNLEANSSRSSIAFYDAQRLFISNIQQATGTLEDANIPNGAVYMRFSGNQDSEVIGWTLNDVLSELSNINNDIINLNGNILNVSTQGAYIDTSGRLEISSITTIYATDFLPIVTQLEYNLAASSSGYVATIAFYDKDKNFISGSPIVVTTGDKTSGVLSKTDCPSNAKYIRCSCRVDSYIKGYNFEELYKALNDEILNYVNGVNGDILTFSTNKAYIRVDSGAYQVSSDASFYATPYLPVINRMEYRLAGAPSGNVAAIAFYDKDKVYISGQSISSTSNTISGILNKADCPQNAVYIRCSCRADSYIKGFNFIDFASILVNHIDLLNESIAEVYGSNVLFNIPSTYIHSIGYEQHTSSANYKCTDFLPVKEVKYENLYVGATASSIAFYDKDKNFISNINNASGKLTNELIPVSAVYMRMSGTASPASSIVGWAINDLLLEDIKTNKRIDALSHQTVTEAALAKQTGSFEVGVNTVHGQKEITVGEYGNFHAKDIEDAYVIDGGNKKHEPILNSLVKTVEIDNTTMYVCHFAKKRVYFSAMRQFIDGGNTDYRTVTARFLAFSTIDDIENYTKITFSEDFPNRVQTNGRIHQCIELNDGGLLVEVENGAELSTGIYVRQLYKVSGFTNMTPVNGVIDIPASAIVKKLTYINANEVVPRTITNYYGEWTSRSSSGQRMLQCWGLSMYGSIVCFSIYDQGGRNANVYFSDDNCDTIKMILNGASDEIQVDVQDAPLGRWPQGKNVNPSADFDWNGTLNGNVHTHGVAYDPYYKRIWAVTGDGNALPYGQNVTGIFYTDDIGETWHFVSLLDLYPAVANTQLISIIPLANCVLFPTDGTGDGIFRYNRNGKDKDVKVELVYQYLGSSTTDYTIPAGNFILPDNKGSLTIFPYGTMAQSILDTVKCGVVYSPDGFSYDTIYQEANPVGAVANSIIHRRSILREYKDFILVSAYNGGYLKLSF